MSSAQFPIRTLSRLTGVSAHALRIWERRYSALTPERTPKGARRYSEADVERVRLLKALIERGHSIGGIAQLPSTELAELLGRARSGARSPVAHEGDGQSSWQSLVSAAAELDVDRAARVLRQAAARLSPRDVILEVMIPALDAVGELWRKKELCVASEHALSALLRTQLGQYLDPSGAGARAAVVCTTLMGELHELGALSAAALAGVHGYRPVYLGPNLPADQIAEAARLASARLVLLSLVALDRERAEAELAALDHELPATVRLVLGGRRAAELSKVPRRTIVLESLEALDAWLSQHGPGGGE